MKILLSSLLIAFTFLLPLPTRAGEAEKPSDAILLTIFLKHDQGKNLAEIQQIQREQGFFKTFPPAGTKIVTWHVVMGIGQVVTLEVPAAKLREVNVALEKTAWKAFRTEYYPTYDLYPVIKDQLANAEKTER
ncbi:hypothetical protein OPIT5_13145 [Opitutaceae bacterium TAV5]|nr:hypothetical protein OPIT5_13145 [Opitutaceae bacterium TAV5]